MSFIVHIRTLEPAPPISQPGDNDGPIVDALKQALNMVGSGLNNAELLPAPPVFPLHYIAVVETTGAVPDSFRDALEQTWQEIQTDEGPAPPAEFEIHNNDD